MEINQGGNKKGVNAAHKAAVLINVITDARMQRKALHIIHTDIKKAFSSTPYEAFHDALRVLGMNPDFMELIVDTQTDFVTTAKGPTGLATPRKKLVGVHEGDCLSPTLFCLLINMYSKWMNALPLGYNMESPNNSLLQSLRIATNAYMDDMALLGNTASECQSLLSYFERFLCFYGMSLNSTKCAYQYKENDVTWKPVEPLTRWGLVPIYGPKQSYKYLGYFINISLDFSTQHKEMVKRLNKACADLRSDHCLSLHDSITYVNSDLVSTLRYRMYLISFPVSYLDIFDARLASAVKRLSHMAKSTITELTDQGLQNIYLLQGSTRTQFLLSALEAPDIHCKLTSRILHARAIEAVSSKGFKGTSPFSPNGLQIATSTRQARKIDKLLPPIFRGVRQNLIKTKSCIQTTFNHMVNTTSRNIDETPKPLALNALINNAGLPFKGCSHKRLNVLFESLEKCLFVSLDEISPLFQINYAENEAWTAMKGLKYLDPKEMCEISGLKELYRLPYLIDSTKDYQKHLDQSSIIFFGELVAHFAFSLLKPYQRDSEATLETSSNWGIFKKGSVAATSIFVDGTCSDKNIFPVKAGFALCVSHCFNLKQNASPNLIIKSRIPGSQTSDVLKHLQFLQRSC
jgi:hypothetical protein